MIEDYLSDAALEEQYAAHPWHADGLRAVGNAAIDAYKAAVREVPGERVGAACWMRVLWSAVDGMSDEAIADALDLMLKDARANMLAQIAARRSANPVTP